MLEIISTYAIKTPLLQGAPKKPASDRLRTLAWLRFLLDELNKVKDWAGRETTTPKAWRTNRIRDADAIRRTFRYAPPDIPQRASERRVLLLDKVFGSLFADKFSDNNRWFSNKLVSGKSHPGTQRLQRLDDLVPGSRMAFYDLPAPLDPWFYNALDFQSPWFGRLFLYRAMDPHQLEPDWEALLQSTPKSARWPHVENDVRCERDIKWSVPATKRRRFADEIETALVHVAFPDEANSAGGFHDGLEQVRAIRAAHASGKQVAHPVTAWLGKLPDAQAFVALTDAIAAYRLAGLVGLEDRGLAAWWLAGAIDALRGRIAKYERVWFYPMTNDAAPLEGMLRKLGLWEPSAALPPKTVPEKKKK